MRNRAAAALCRPAWPQEGRILEENRYKKLASNTVLFAISSFSGKLLTLFIQPFITYAMREVEEVGITKLTSQCANLLIPLVGLGIS